MKKNKMWIYFFVLSLFFPVKAISQQFKESPVVTVRKIGDKLIRETPFAYKLDLFCQSDKFNYLKFVDFGRTFGQGYGAVG